MLEPAEAARRRELQHRAFAPGGALSAEETAELRALEARHRGPKPETAPPPAQETAPTASLTEPADAAVREATVPAAGVAAVNTADTEPPDAAPHALSTEPQPAPARRRITPALLVTVAVFAILGVLAGKALFSPHDAPRMDAAQQDRWTALEASGEYDPGSITFAGSQYGADVWQATQKNGERECLILTRGEQVNAGCQVSGPEAEQENGPLQISMDYQENDTNFGIWVSVEKDVNGNPALLIRKNNYDSGYDWRSNFSDEQLAQMQPILDAGFTGDFLSIIGYDEDTPVWLSQEDATCLLLVREGVIHKQCGQLLADTTPGLTLITGNSAYSAHASSSGGVTLTITRGSGG